VAMLTQLEAPKSVTRPSTAKEAPRSTTTAAAAASLQSQNRVAIDIQTGRLIKPKPSVANGDVSFLHDSLGHNLSTSTSHHQRPVQLPKLSRANSRGATTEDIDTLARVRSGPASRADAIAVADGLRADLARLGPDVPAATEAAIWDTAFATLNQQVGVHCEERGAILEKIRLRQLELMQQVQVEKYLVEKELTEWRAAHEEMVDLQKLEANQNSKHAKHTMLFKRAVARQSQDRSQAEIEEEQRRLQEAMAAHSVEMQRANVKEAQLVAELEAARARCETLQEKVDEPMDLQRILAHVPSLSGEDECALSLALLERARQGEAQPTLPHLKKSEQRAVLKGLLDPLPATMRVDLVASTLASSFNPVQLALILREALGASPPDVVADAIGPLFMVTHSDSVSATFLLEAASRRQALVKAFMAKLGQMERTAPELWSAVRPPQSKLKKALEERERKVQHLTSAVQNVKQELEAALQLNESMQQLHASLEARYSRLQATVIAEVEMKQEAPTSEVPSSTDDEPERPSSAPIKSSVAAIKIAVSSNKAHRAQIELEREREARLQQLLEMQAAATRETEAWQQQRAQHTEQLLMAREKIAALETVLRELKADDDAERRRIEKAEAMAAAEAASASAAAARVAALEGDIATARAANAATEHKQKSLEAAVAAAAKEATSTGATDNSGLQVELEMVTAERDALKEKLRQLQGGATPYRISRDTPHYAPQLPQLEMGTLDVSQAATSAQAGIDVTGTQVVAAELTGTKRGAPSESVARQGVAGELVGTRRMAGELAAPAVAPTATLTVPGLQEATGQLDTKEVPATPRQGRWLGSICIESTSRAPMSLTAIYRLVSSLTNLKVLHNATKLPVGQRALDMGEFVGQSALSMHGGRKLAQRYLEQMYAALKQHRKASARLQLFAACTGLFPDDMLPAESQIVVHEALGAAISHLVDDKGHTGVSSARAFYEPFAHATKDVYVPLEAMRLGLRHALAAEPLDSQQSIEQAMETYISATLALSEDACHAASARNVHCKRAHLLGKTGPYVQVDGFLMELAKRHRAECSRRSLRVCELVDVHNGQLMAVNGGETTSHNSLDHFTSLVDKVHPGLPPAAIEKLHGTMRLGVGPLSASELESALVMVGQAQRPSLLGGALDLTDVMEAEAELAEAAQTWQDAMVTAPQGSAIEPVGPQGESPAGAVHPGSDTPPDARPAPPSSPPAGPAAPHRRPRASAARMKAPTMPVTAAHDTTTIQAGGQSFMMFGGQGIEPGVGAPKKAVRTPMRESNHWKG